MYLPIFLPWAKQPTPHTPPPCLLPRQCEERPGVKCKRENAVVQTVPTTSVSLSLPLSCSWFLPATLPHACLLLCFSVIFLSLVLPSLSLSLSQVGWLLQVAGAQDPSANEKWVPSCAVTLMNLAVRRPITLLHLASPGKTALRHTHTRTCTVHAHTRSKCSGPNICLVEGRGCARVAQTHGQEGLFCLCVLVCIHITPQLWSGFEIIFRYIC